MLVPKGRGILVCWVGNTSVPQTFLLAPKERVLFLFEVLPFSKNSKSVDFQPSLFIVREVNYTD